MATQRNSNFEIQFLGQRYSLKFSEADQEVAQEVISLIEKKLELASKRTKSSAPMNVALLAILDLAEEYVRAKGRTREWQRKVNEKSAQILSIVDGAGLAKSNKRRDSKASPSL